MRSRFSHARFIIVAVVKIEEKELVSDREKKGKCEKGGPLLGTVRSWPKQHRRIFLCRWKWVAWLSVLLFTQDDK